MTFPTEPELDSFTNPDSPVSSAKWSENFRESLWKVPEFYEMSYTPPNGWTYGYRCKPENVNSPELWEWWRKSPEGEWEKIDADDPDAVAFRSTMHIQNRVIDNFSDERPT